MINKKIIPLLLVGLITFGNGIADEGMWIPLFLGELNEKEMQEMGMNITAEDIYSINQSSLKDAVVIFGGGCTGEVVSDEGLILTNHHCGYGRIQAHSSLENDYLTNGFWAMDKSEELPNPGLTVTFLVRMEEVTEKALEGVDQDMSEQQRSLRIRENIEKIEKDAIGETHYKASVRPFFQGNRYFLFVNEVFEDVRLVGAPPSNIGKFGGDTDNWMWPRHTGDFSVFRIYADKENKPAPYSEDNVPYKPKKHMTISLDGVDEGDFTFVFGYPGSTQQYIPSFQVDLITRINPVRIKLRDKKLDIIKQAMNSDPKIRIQYAAKQAGISNSWKKWIGVNRGIKRLDAVEKKREFENEFNEWAGISERNKAAYGNLLAEYKKYTDLSEPFEIASAYLIEAGFGVEILRFARSFNSLVAASNNGETGDEQIEALVEKMKSRTSSHFRNYQMEVDKRIFVSMMESYLRGLEDQFTAPELKEMAEKYRGDMEDYADMVYKKSIFANEEEVTEFLEKFKRSKYRKIKKDPAFRLAEDFAGFYYDVLQEDLDRYDTKTDSLQRIYMRGLMEMQRERTFYPDANFTLRVAYGKVEPYYPADAVFYNYFTTLEGIMEKEDPAIYDYVVEDRLKQLYQEKDYGRYADEDGSMHVCFIATNHTSGGNSGSPVLNADGHLIGINFDRCWEGTMSDVIYDPAMCRNITLDIRYCLFIIDKFAGAGHLIEEMTFTE